MVVCAEYYQVEEDFANVRRATVDQLAQLRDHPAANTLEHLKGTLNFPLELAINMITGLAVHG